MGPVETRSYRDIVSETTDDFRVRTEVYVDPQIFDDEMERIFENSWTYVAHDSEICQPGDYKTTAIGRLPVIVSRAGAGKIHVLLNTCRHRGSIVCREERGNSRFFRCPYHNWVYSNTGALLSISNKNGYPAGWGSDIGGLIEAQVEAYRGLIFARFADQGQSLDEHLGPVKHFIDLWLDQSPTGRVRLLTPQKASYPANWKFQLENTSDGWHARYVHDSAFRTMHEFRQLGGEQTEKKPYHYDDSGQSTEMPGGHAAHERIGKQVRPLPQPFYQRYMELLTEAYGEDRADLITHRRHITVFPNLHLMQNKFRVIHPVSVDKTIIYEYPVQFEGIADEINQAFSARLRTEGGLASGFVNSDDVEIFGRVQSGLQGARRMPWLIFSRGMHREEVRPEGGHFSSDASDENTQRGFYREWIRRMDGREL